MTSSLATGRLLRLYFDEGRLFPDIFLPAFKHPGFTDRISHAANARAATINRFQARPGPDDPRIVAKIQERRELHEGRLARQAERQRLKDEELARGAEARRLLEEQELAAALAREAQAQADAEMAQQARRERLAAKTSNMADQKADRDARYAARKARQKR